MGNVVVRCGHFLSLLLGWSACNVCVLCSSDSIWLTFSRMTQQTHSLESMTAMWLLPVVTLIVASSSGGVMGKPLQDYSNQNAMQTVTTSIFLVIVGFSLAFMILVIYLQKLITYGIPTGGTVLSVFLPLGPTGQAGYSVLLIGENLRKMVLINNFKINSQLLTTGAIPTVIDITCVFTGFVLWSLATMWILYAFLAIYSGLHRSTIAFRMNFWGLIFPNVCIPFV